MKLSCGLTYDGQQVFLTRWTDNPVVTVASTTPSSRMSNTVKRWRKEKRDKIDVTIPDSIYISNKYMGGTDQRNNNVKIIT